MSRIMNYLFNGGDEKESLLASADYCAGCAVRELELGDEIGMYRPLAEEALRLRAKAEGRTLTEEQLEVLIEAGRVALAAN